MSESESPDLLNVLRAGPVGVSSPGEVERERERMVPWLEDQVELLPEQRALHLRGQRRRRWLYLGGAVAAAAALAVVVSGGPQESSSTSTASVQEAASALGSEEGHATLLSGKVMSGSVDLLAGSRLALSSRVQTGKDSGAALHASEGYQLALSPETEMAFLPSQGTRAAKQGQLRLYRGIVTLSVAPLPQGSTLSVLTDDAKVTVIGTTFSVESQPGEPTCVRVTSGQVRIERGSERKLLGEGQSWGCRARDAGLEGVDVGTVTIPLKPSGAAAAPTTLQQESELLSAALSRERQGKSDSARRAYQELLRKYPGSSFAQDARAGLSRLAADAAEK